LKNIRVERSFAARQEEDARCTDETGAVPVVGAAVCPRRGTGRLGMKRVITLRGRLVDLSKKAPQSVTHVQPT